MTAAVRIDNPDVSLANERDPPLVGRPRRRVAVPNDHPLPATVAVGHPNVAIAHEGKLPGLQWTKRGRGVSRTTPAVASEQIMIGAAIATRLIA